LEPKERSSKIILLLFYVLALFAYSSCSESSKEKKDLESGEAGGIVPPISVLITNPISPLPDTCPPPVTIVVPTTPIGQTIIKNGKAIKFSPPEIKPADFFSPMQNYNTDNGLAMDVVACAIMDRKGNLWFGTAGGGVSRYDGKSFTNFTTAQGLANNVVNSIVEDKSGNLWFGTQGGGASRYDGRSFTNFASAQGLASDFILSIAEDKTGTLWFGTDGGGISRYDGHITFTNFTVEQGLANNIVRSIIEDKKGTIWFGTDGGGVSRYNGKAFANYTTAQGLASNVVLSIKEDKVGNIWFGTNGGASCYNGNRDATIESRDVITSQIKQDVKKANEKFVKSESLSKTGFTNYSTTQGLADNVVNSITEDNAGNIWFGTNAGTSRFDGKSFFNYTTKQGLANNVVYSITEYKTGSLWFGTYGGGISRYDGNCFTNFTTKQGLANNSVFSIVEDKTGNIWFGTYGGGVSCYDGNRVDDIDSGDSLAKQMQSGIKETTGGLLKSFTNYTPEQGLATYYVLSSLEDRTGKLWFGTFGGGVSCYDGHPKDGSAVRFTTYTTAQGLANDVVNYIKEDKDGNIWFATDGGGVSRYNGKCFTNYTTAQGLASDVVNCISDDKAGNLWFATSGGGVSRYDEQKGVAHFTNYTIKQGLANNTVWSIKEDEMGNIWFATSGEGVSRYDGKSFLNFTTTQGLPDNLITQVVITKEQNILFGTNLGVAMLKGFVIVPDPTSNRDKDRERDSSAENAIQNNEMFPAQNNSSNEDLRNYTPVFEIYNSSTGYPVKDVNAGQNAMFVDSKGIIWIATGSDKTGLVRFDYAALNKNNFPPDVFIQGVRINNEDVYWSDLISTFKTDSLKSDSTATPANITEEVTVLGKTLSKAERNTIRKKFGDIKFDGITKFYPIPQNLVLPYAHNHIAFDFAAIEPDRPSLVRYQYILEGYGNEWSPISNKTSAVFGNMYEGTYTFKLKARSPFGIWSKPIEYKFTVLPPWWRSWWMKTVYAIIFLLIIITVFFYVKHRIRIIRKREEEKTMLNKQISDIEMKALRSQMNPHFIFNVMNSVQNYILENDRVTAQDYLAKFARLMRHVLENSKAENITLDNEIETLKLYVMLEQLRTPDKFTYKVDVDPSISIADTLIMPMLIQPFIENAIIHGMINKNGNDGKINLTIKRSNDQLVCVIEDNGIGRKSAQKIKAARSTSHKSLGMNVTEERISIINNLHGKNASVIIEDQMDESMNPAGTRVTLTIPYIIQNN
jgi:ligand-binding sensor domain-containing protein/two-component sensor histidine kinase